MVPDMVRSRIHYRGVRFHVNNSSMREDARGLQGHLHKTNKKAKEVGGGRAVRRWWVIFQCWDVLLIWIIVGQGPKEREKEKRNDRREKKCPNNSTRTYSKRIRPLLYSTPN